MKTPRITGKLALALLTIFASSYAAADDAGWYVGANAGQSNAKIDDGRIINGLSASGLSTTSIRNDNRDVGFRFFGGYQFNPYFSLEASYFDLGRFGFAANTVPTGTETGSMQLRGVSFDALGMLPVTDKFSAFGRVGMNYAEAQDAFSGTGAVHIINPSPSHSEANYDFGAGLQYALTDSVAMRLEAERYRINDAVGNKGDIDLVSVGLVYRFGKTPPPPIVEAPPAPVCPPPVEAAAPPPPPAPAPRFETYTLSATDLFAFNSAKLRMPQPKLDEIANALAANPDINNVVITGYADRIGSDAYNKKLSEQRADAVMDYFENKGIAANRMQAVGKGKEDPVVMCNNKKRAALIKCLEPNRRVQVQQITIEKRAP